MMMNYWVVFVFVATYIGNSWSLPKTLACPNCNHLSYNLINIPSKYVSAMQYQLSTLEQRNNMECVKNTASPGVCPAPIQDKVSTCETLWYKIQAIGTTNLPEFFVVIRSCGTQANSTADLCTSVHDLPYEAKYEYLMNLIPQLKKLYTSVTFEGQLCVSSTGNTTALDDVLNKANPVAATFWASILCLSCFIAFI